MYYFSETFVEFKLANVGCNYELNWNNLYENWEYYKKISENKTAVFFIGENHHAELVEGTC